MPSSPSPVDRRRADEAALNVAAEDLPKRADVPIPPARSSMAPSPLAIGSASATAQVAAEDLPKRADVPITSARSSMAPSPLESWSASATPPDSAKRRKDVKAEENDN